MEKFFKDRAEECQTRKAYSFAGGFVARVLQSLTGERAQT